MIHLRSLSMTTAAALLLLAGCSDDDNGGSSALDGTWVGRCEAGETASQQARFVFSGSTARFVSTTHLDPDCTTPAADFIVEGQNEVTGQTTISTGAQADNIDSTLDTATFTPLTEMAAANASFNLLCGRDDWQAGVSVDVGDCAEFNLDLPQTTFDLALIIDDVLYFGDTETGDSETAATRPTDIDFTDPYRRQ